MSWRNVGDLSLSDRKIIIGIDFGTTYSGLAWAETRRPDHIVVVDSWPSGGAQEGASSVKVPTELRYRPEGDGYEWGFQIPGIVDRHQWFKLLSSDVAENCGLRDLDNKASPAPNKEHHDAEKLLRDYLAALRRHLIYTMKQKLGAAIRNVQTEFVLTVPAIWSEVAKAKTLRACQAAGFEKQGPMILVSEPEAAAMYTLHGLDPSTLKVGDSFVLCDAGGGTVDLISYTITALSPTLEIEEAAAGSGALCGSTFLNRRFGEFLTKKFRREEGWDADTLAEGMVRFELFIKKQYSPSTYTEGSYSIPVSGLSNNEKLGIKRGKFQMKPSDMKEIFEPVVSQVISLVKDQILATNRKIKAVLLVGGFGQNNYLKERLRSALNTNSNKIEVIQPPHAWTAVVQGAVMKGLANYDSKLDIVHVGPRTARKHYGVELNRKYNEAIHLKATKKWNAYYGEYRAPCMTWFIKRGDPVLESSPSSIGFWQLFPVSNGLPQSHSMTVYCDRVSSVAPLQANENVVQLVRLSASLSSLKGKLPKKKGKDGKKYYVLEGLVEAAYGSASTEYTLVHKGQRYKTVTAEYV